MSNYYSIMTAECALPCSKEEFEQLNTLLHMCVEGCNEIDPGLCLEWMEADNTDPGGVYFFSDEIFNADDIPEAVLKRIGSLIAAAGLPYLQLGAAFACDKLRSDSHGGTCYRIYPNGDLVEQQVFWPARDGKNNIIVEVSGGLVCTVYVDQGLAQAQCDVLDRDNEKATEPGEREEFKELEAEIEGLLPIYG